MTEAEAIAAGRKVQSARFPFAALGRALAAGETDGFVKIVYDERSHLVLGVHIVGGHATDLISEAALAIEMGATLEDIQLTVHPHPTLGESMMEAARVGTGETVHILLPKRQPQSAAR
jgi:dihydrolipoamide dehydrogenase